MTTEIFNFLMFLYVSSPTWQYFYKKKKLTQVSKSVFLVPHPTLQILLQDLTHCKFLCSQKLPSQFFPAKPARRIKFPRFVVSTKVASDKTEISLKLIDIHVFFFASRRFAKYHWFYGRSGILNCCWLWCLCPFQACANHPLLLSALRFFTL